MLLFIKIIMLAQFKKQKTHTENKNILTSNNLTQKKLSTYNKNCFFSTYGLFCLLDILKNGSEGEIYNVLCDLVNDEGVHNLATSDTVFKNTTLIFHADHLKLSDKFEAYLKSNKIIKDAIDVDAFVEGKRECLYPFRP